MVSVTELDTEGLSFSARVLHTPTYKRVWRLGTPGRIIRTASTEVRMVAVGTTVCVCVGATDYNVPRERLMNMQIATTTTATAATRHSRSAEASR